MANRKVTVRGNKGSEFVDMPSLPPIVSDRFHLDSVFGVTDTGNFANKRMRTGEPSSAIVSRNQITYLTMREWSNLIQRYPTGADFTRENPNTWLFALVKRNDKGLPYPKAERDNNLIPVVVGDHAGDFGSATIMTDETKYIYEYAGPALGSTLLSLFDPDIYDKSKRSKVVLGLAHPTRSFPHRNLMQESNGGRHVFRLPDRVNGKHRDIGYRVTEVFFFDEPSGGLVKWSDNLEVKMNAFDLKSGSNVLVVDFGGALTSCNRVRVGRDIKNRLQFFPLYETAQSPIIELGVHDVVGELRSQLLSLPEFRGMARTIDMLNLEGVIKTGKTELHGKTVDVTDYVYQAENRFLHQFRMMYESPVLAGGRGFALVVCTGGGQTAYYSRLRDDILNFEPERVHLAHDLSRINFANLLGGDILMRQWMAHEQGLIDLVG